MRILYIAPFPPPITGHSLAAEVLFEHLQQDHVVDVVNLSIGSSSDGSFSTGRAVEVLKVLRQVWRKQRHADVVYLTISESLAGNVKDLLIYLLCASRLSRFYIHLHGGSIKKLLFDPYPLLRRLNAFAIRRMGGVIISGKSHMPIFADLIQPQRIHIVPNFAIDELFIPESDLRRKFTSTSPLRVIYISGMTDAKGYRDLVAAYRLLPPATKARVQLDFAGKFDSDSERERFVAEIADEPGMRYHGLVTADAKRRLFADAHVFCLPTTMFEGQPISILEAYASGCVVVVTGQDGIRDIFTDGVNGAEIEPRRPESIARVLARLAESDSLESIAVTNRRLGEDRYRTSRFNAAVARILDGKDPAPSFGNPVPPSR